VERHPDAIHHPVRDPYPVRHTLNHPVGHPEYLYRLVAVRHSFVNPECFCGLVQHSNSDSFGDPVGDPVVDAVHDSWIHPVRDSVGDPVRDTERQRDRDSYAVRDSVGDPVGDPYAVRDAVSDAVRDAVSFASLIRDNEWQMGNCPTLT
jgi:hypothetical protein